MENYGKTPEKRDEGCLSPILGKSSRKLFLKRRQQRSAMKSREIVQETSSFSEIIVKSQEADLFENTSLIDRLENMELRKNSIIDQLSTTKALPQIKIDIHQKPQFIPNKNSEKTLNIDPSVPQSPTIKTGSGKPVCISDKGISEARKLFSDILDISEQSRRNKFNYLHQTSPFKKPAASVFGSEDFGDLKFDHNVGFKSASAENKAVQETKIFSNSEQLFLSKVDTGFKIPIEPKTTAMINPITARHQILPENSSETIGNAAISDSEYFGDLTFDQNVGLKNASVNPMKKQSKDKSGFITVSELKTTPIIPSMSNWNASNSPGLKKRNIFAGEDFSDLRISSKHNLPRGSTEMPQIVGFKSASANLVHKQLNVNSVDFRPVTTPIRRPMTNFNSSELKKRNIFAGENFDDLRITSAPIGFVKATIDSSETYNPIVLAKENVDNLGVISVKTPVVQGFKNIFAGENLNELNLACLKKPPVKRLFQGTPQKLTNDTPFKSPLVKENPNFEGFSRQEQGLSQSIQNDFRKFITSKNRFFAVSILQNEQQLINTRKRKLPTISPIPQKNCKHLGVSFTPTVKISEQGLQRAKLIFEEVATSKSPPNKPESTQLRGGFILCKPFGGDLDSLLNNLRRERELLEEKLRINEEKTLILLRPRQFTKICPGLLTRAKQTALLSLKSLQPQFTASNSINPQNAHLLHFCLNVPYLKTLDGAFIVPNQDKVGFEEIRRGFEGMEGVDSHLIPDKWVRNHFKWIVWKLASYERFFGRECLDVENVVQQLKFRYDLEIDQAKRPIIRKIFEKDDSPQRRLVLCVSKIIKTSTGYELELTDGWYPIKTTPDAPLQNQIAKGKIHIGMKLLIYGAELHHVEPCHPLEGPADVSLKIYYNSTRRVKWWCKLGEQKQSGPFMVPLNSVHVDGGKIGCINCYIYRVYPIQYVQKISGKFLWKNKRAHEFRSQNYQNIRHVVDGRVLYDLMQQSNDPEGLEEMLSTQQKQLLYEHARKGRLKREGAEVTAVLKMKIMDGRVTRDFSIWSPNEELLDGLKEGEIVNIYNVSCSKKWGLTAGPRTHFQPQPKNPIYDKLQRKVTLVSDLKSLKPMEEFDTVGFVVEKYIDEVQHLWIAHKDKKLLLVTVNFPSTTVLLLDQVAQNQLVAISNLTLKYIFGTHAVAYADQRTLVTKYPQQRYLKETMNEFDMHGMQELLQECHRLVGRIGMDVDGMECSQMTMTDLALMESVDQLI